MVGRRGLYKYLPGRRRDYSVWMVTYKTAAGLLFFKSQPSFCKMLWTHVATVHNWHFHLLRAYCVPDPVLNALLVSASPFILEHIRVTEYLFMVAERFCQKPAFRRVFKY